MKSALRVNKTQFAQFQPTRETRYPVICSYKDDERKFEITVMAKDLPHAYRIGMVYGNVISARYAD